MPNVDAGDERDAVPALRRLAGIAREMGMARLANEAESLSDRVSAGQFYVACVGQFKRGKSTLLDALVGDPVLPTGVVPVTAVPTVVRYGAQRTARVRLADGDWREIDPDDLVEYVSEERNPENEKRVAGVEVSVPARLLASGMCLVDTPGLGSVFEGNAELTRALVPHIDAAIVVIGADPPLSGDELTLVESVARQVSSLLFVLNKADRVSDEERDAAIQFARRVLEGRLRRPVDRILQVSAIERLRDGGPTRDWDVLNEALETLARGSGRELVRAAGDRGRKRIGLQLLAAIEQRRDALRSPIEETEKRVAALDAVARDAERSIHELSYLLFAEQQRLARRFAADRDEFLARATPVAQRELMDAIAGVSSRWGPALRRDMFAHAREIARRHVTPWLVEQQANAEGAYRQAFERFIEHANAFLERLADAGDSRSVQLAGTSSGESGFRARSSFYFNELIHIAQPASPFRLLLDIALGLLGVRSAFERSAHRFLARLLYLNSARVQNDVEDRVVESRRLLEREIAALLTEVRGSAASALATARETRKAGMHAVQAALTELDALERQVREASAA